MHSIADYLSGSKKNLSRTVFAEKGAVEAVIQSLLPSGAPPVKFSFKEGVLTVSSGAALRSEVYAKREKIVAALKQKFPHLSITEVR